MYVEFEKKNEHDLRLSLLFDQEYIRIFCSMLKCSHLLSLSCPTLTYISFIL